jgi:hypothetical protein
MMFKVAVILALIAVVAAFNVHRPLKVNSKMQMPMEKNAVRIISAVVAASSLISAPVFAKEGDAAKIGIFTNNDMSSPFAAGENREDPIYSPYSPYGNGEKAVYNARKGTAEELKFWQAKFEEGT